MLKNLQKIKTWGKTHWPIWLLLLISAIVYHKWLSFGIFTHEDYWFWFSESMRDFLQYSTWNSQIDLGAPNMVLWMWTWKFLPAVFAFFGFDSNIWDKFIIFWPFAFLAPIFSYLFAHQILKNKMGAFVAALVFSFNTYYLAINTQGHFSLTLAGTFAVLAMFFFWRYFETEKKKNLIASALVCLIAGGYDFRIFYMLFFIFLALPFWLFFAQKTVAQKKLFFKKTFLSMTLFFGLLFLFNLFWLWPTAATGSLATNEIVARPLVGNNFSLDLEKTLTLFHPFWNGGEPMWFKAQKIPLYFWLIPVMVTLGAYWNRKNKKILFWLFVALVAIFLSKQDVLPLKSAYVWLHQNFPGFNAFREASKFYFAIALAYAILIGAFVKFIFENYAKHKYLKVGVFLGASLIFLWNAKPILTGEMSSIFTPQKIAGDELKIREYMFLQEGSFRTLWHPFDSKWASFSAYRPKINAFGTRDSDWGKIKDYADLQGDGPGGTVKNKLLYSEEFTARLFSQSAVRYLIFGQADFGTVKNLVTNSEWRKIDLGLREKVLFENQAVRPRIYSTKNPETIHREIAFQEVDYSMQNSSRWNFKINNFNEPVWLNFSEKYHPDWKLSCGDFKWYDVFRAKPFFPDDKHRMTDARLNAFLLDPTEVQKKCLKGGDNNTIALSLVYRPQSYLYLGGIISLGAVLLSVLALVFWKEKSYANKIEQKEKNAK